MKEIKWTFSYKKNSYQNILQDTLHGDFKFIQNDFHLNLDQNMERYFLGLLIYAMQKIKSPEIAKDTLNKKDWKKHLDSNYDYYDYYNFYSLPFIKLDTFGELELSYAGYYKRIAKVDKELIIKDDNHQIIFPYSQLSKTIDNLLVASEKGFFRTNINNYAKTINHYVSGEFEEMYALINNKINT